MILVEDNPVPVNVAGEYRGEPLESSYVYEPEIAPSKVGTDVVLIGSAFGRGGSCVDVTILVGTLRKTVRVFGDRFWYRSLTGIERTEPAFFDKIPLTYERAFGGWDRSHPDPKKHGFEPRNPVGIGFRLRGGRFEEGVRLPNLEDPRQLISNYGDTPPPAGFGFTSPDWQPRASFAGTYDDQWMKERMPLLPKDFDRRFFSAASAGLTASGYLNGDEAVSIENASPQRILSFNLPGVPPPKCRVKLTQRRDAEISMLLDTVIINTDKDLLLLLWRGNLALGNGPHDVVSIQIEGESVAPQLATG
jgi:hypothetical protein